MERIGTTLTKPPYRVPLVSEVAALPHNGYNVVSLFSGGGGSCFGFRMDGYKVLYANEFVESARATYRANASPDTYLDDRDVRTVTGDSIRKIIGTSEIDILEGSPPCSAFSTAGKINKHWGQVNSYSDTEQRVDDLFFEYSRLVGELRPKVFIAENVKGLVRGVSKGYFLEILSALRAHGYKVETRVLNAAWLGVPQARERLIFVGVRNDLALDPAFPDPLPYSYSIQDAIPTIRHIEQVKVFGEGSILTEGKEPLPTVSAAGVGIKNAYQVEVTSSEDLDVDPETGANLNIDRYAIGLEWKQIRQGGKSQRYFSLVRPKSDAPSPTITAIGGITGVASVTHPDSPRKFSLTELRLLSGFPTDFQLVSAGASSPAHDYRMRWERIGRAVPPPMMYAVAKAVRENILEKVKE